LHREGIVDVRKEKLFIRGAKGTVVRGLMELYKEEIKVY
jgi:hypothetical protein